MTLKEFQEKYGTNGASMIIDALIARLPEGHLSLKQVANDLSFDLESALIGKE